MPYDIKKNDGNWCIYKADDGTLVENTCHDTKAGAEAQLKAILAATHAERVRLTPELLDAICPECAAKLRESGFKYMEVRQMPAQMLEGLCNSLGSDPGLFGRCMDKSFGDFDPGNKEAFCAWLHYECVGEWPGAGRERAVSMQSIYMTLSEQLQATDEYAVINDLYDDNGQLIAIVTSRGKLYRVAIMLDGTTIQTGVMQEVEPQFAPVRAGRLRILRQADGRVRWFSVAETAVLNRVNEIDSRALFDSFVANAPTEGYPILTFYHDMRLRMGMADWVAREENCYVASGLLDEDNPLADAFVDAIEKKRGEWGTSVGFQATEPPTMCEIADGVTIPVYVAGVNREIATLPEARAASWMTNITMEVMRMRNEVKDALKVLFANDALAEQFIAQVDATNREIKDSGMITRQDAAPAETSAVPAPVLAETVTREPPAAAVEPMAQTPQAAPVAYVTKEELDAMLKALPVPAPVDLSGIQAMLVEMKTDIAALQRSDDEKRERWVADMPARKVTEPAYRPRQQAPAGKPALEDIAAATLANMPAQFSRKA